MKITLEQIKKLRPCKEGLAWYEENVNSEDLITILVEIDNYRPDWARWLFTNLMDKDQYVEVAIYSAKLVLNVFEEKYPNDERPRKAIEAAEKYLENKNDDTHDAVDAARAAAVDAARAAAVDAAYAAAYAAYAAYIAVDADDADEVRIKIINKAVEILERYENKEIVI